jgi:hypothetical protein
MDFLRLSKKADGQKIERYAKQDWKGAAKAI